MVLFTLFNALMMQSVRGQMSKLTTVEFRAVTQSGVAIKNVRVGLLPKTADRMPVVLCHGATCDNVTPGEYTLLVFADGMLTIRRDIYITNYDSLVFVEMVPLLIQEPSFPGIKSIIVNVPPIETSRYSTALSIRLLGVLNGVIRSLPVLGVSAEFRGVHTGKYILLLLRDGKCVEAKAIWHNDEIITRESLGETKDGCVVHIP
ncbi:MAG TPA: hypothetical protein VFQ91_26915 [Bryobacteraceae bacterium]|nr:hypothetical protein [Bryobacteraceae bacterium]